MKLLLRHQASLVLAAGLVFFTYLGGSAFFDENESQNAACSAEMFRSSAWMVPTFNDELETKTPILINWFMLAAFHLIGISEFSARLTSSLLAVGTTLLTYHLGRKLYSAEIGWLAGIIICTCLLFSAVGRSATPDSTLAFFVTLSFTSYVWIVSRQRGGSFSRGMTRKAKTRKSISSVEEDKPGSASDGTSCSHSLMMQLAPATWKSAVPMYVAVGIAVLARGLVGAVLPCAIIVLFLSTSQRFEDLQNETLQPPEGPRWRKWLRAVAQILRPKKVLDACRGMKLPVGIGLVAAIALPWYLIVGVMTNGAWLEGYLTDHDGQATATAKGGYSGFPLHQLYQIVAIHLGCFPWSAFLPVAAYRLWERLTEGAAWRDSDRLLACWTGVWFICFSLVSTNMPNDLLPMYPAIALILARYFDDWKCEKIDSGVYSFQLCCRAMWIAGIAMALGLSIVAYLFFPTEQWFGLIGFVPVIGALIASRFLDQEQRHNVMRTLVASALLLAFLLVGFAPTRLRPYQDSPVFVADARRFAKTADVEIATFDYFEPSVVFYAEKKVLKLDGPRQVADFISSHPHAFVITKAARYSELREVLLGDVSELTRHRNFFTGHELILIGRN